MLVAVLALAACTDGALPGAGGGNGDGGTDGGQSTEDAEAVAAAVCELTDIEVAAAVGFSVTAAGPPGGTKSGTATTCAFNGDGQQVQISGSTFPGGAAAVELKKQQLELGLGAASQEVDGYGDRAFLLDFQVGMALLIFEGRVQYQLLIGGVQGDNGPRRQGLDALARLILD